MSWRASFNLPVADKSDSQDICFVPTGTLHRRHRAAEAERPELRRHRARRRPHSRPSRRHHHYTIGQRRGIKIPAAEALYVVRLDAARNEVVVGPRAALTTARPYA